MSDEVLVWLSVWSEVQIICVWSSWCHGHPVISCFIKIQIGLTFLVPACPGCPGKEAVNGVSICLHASSAAVMPSLKVAVFPASSVYCSRCVHLSQVWWMSSRRCGQSLRWLWLPSPRPPLRMALSRLTASWSPSGRVFVCIVARV